MTRRERVNAAIRGEKPDKTPFTFWYHFHLTPPAGPNMAETELAFYRKYDLDIFKVMHDIDYEPTEEVKSIDDWAKLRSMDGFHGNFGQQVATVGMIVDQVKGEDVPVINTVFNTFRYAHRVSHGKVLEHLRQDPEKVKPGLRAITESLVSFTKALLSVGVDGIYFAVHGASTDFALPDEYERHFLDLDRQVLDAAKPGTLNIVHLHSYETLYFDMTHDLPAHVLCFSDRAAGPSLLEARKTHAGCLMGGIDEAKFPNMTPEEIKAQGREAIEQMRGTPFILSPGCSVPDASPEHLCRAIAPDI
jgi:uroporphyrinogen decarboxylase